MLPKCLFQSWNLLGLLKFARHFHVIYVISFEVWLELANDYEVGAVTRQDRDQFICLQANSVQ